jgi:hypothetical protein
LRSREKPKSETGGGKHKEGNRCFVDASLASPAPALLLLDHYTRDGPSIAREAEFRSGRSARVQLAKETAEKSDAHTSREKRAV